MVGSVSAVTLTTDAVFQPECTAALRGAPDSASPTSVANLRDPFFASVIVQAYAIAAATVLSYMLFLMLLITPRTFFIGGPGGGRRFLGGRGLINRASGRTPVIGVGTRPWLQKVAALTVVISLTIATADTFRVAKQQYETGYMSATKLRDQVAGGTLIKAVRVISDACVWLAQVQTLIRLFPRQKEKVIIKWVGLALIVFETFFSLLNSFVFANAKSKTLVDAIPTIAYLFELALGLLYAAWVVFYSVSRRRFAFYHYKMRNICLVAALALSAVSVPIVFFVLDISNPSLAGWGDYFRWVGAAAASVVVWEWVERIEALERDERKDGVLGREIYDGDDMLDITPSEELDWHAHRTSTTSHRRSGGGGAPRPSHSATVPGWRQAATTANQFPRSLLGTHAQSVQQGEDRMVGTTRYRPTGSGPGNPQLLMSGACPSLPVPPHPVASPVSRSDTTSAASTVYAVHHHPVRNMTPNAPDTTAKSDSTSQSDDTRPRPTLTEVPAILTSEPVDLPASGETMQAPSSTSDHDATTPENGYTTSNMVSNPFKRRNAASQALSEPIGRDAECPMAVDEGPSRRGLKAMLGKFITSPSHSAHTSGRASKDDAAPLPVTIVPAQPRGRTFSPDSLRPLSTPAPDQINEPTGPVSDASQRARKGKAVDRSTGESSSAPKSSSTSPSPAAIQEETVHRRGDLVISETRPERGP